MEQLLEQLKQEQQQSETLRLALDEMCRDAEAVQHDAKYALDQSDQVKQQLETTWRHRLEEKELELQAVRDAQIAAGRASSVVLMQSPPPSTQRLTQPVSTRASLRAESMLPEPEEDELLPKSVGTDHDYVSQVREAQTGLGEAMRNANQVHLASLDMQLVVAAENLKKGVSSSHSLYECVLPHIELERQAAASRIESRMHDLIALKEEANVHHELDGTPEKQQIFDYIDRDVARCKEEVQLLKSVALAEMPENLLEAIVGYANGSRMSKYDGLFSPAHWAAKRGRRDLLYFIHQQAGGLAMLHARDDLGRTPLFYAERNRSVGLIHFLQSVLRSGGPSSGTLSQQPEALDGTAQQRFSIIGGTRVYYNVGKLPPAYKKLLDQIERRGWSTVTWKDNYTMLHWAASKGNDDLCAYLIQLNADPSVKDCKAQTPSVCAAAAGHPDIVQLLQGAQASRPSKSLGSLGSMSITTSKQELAPGI